MELMGSSVRALAAGRRHSVALLPQRVLAWGAGSMGQLGLGTAQDKIASPTSIDTLKVSKCAHGDVSLCYMSVLCSAKLFFAILLLIVFVCFNTGQGCVGRILRSGLLLCHYLLYVHS